MKNKSSNKSAANYWLNQIQKPSFHAGSGYAFEAVCFKHIDQIINTLHLKTADSISSWRHRGIRGITGAQIDLLIDRADDAITLIEIKYTSKPLMLDKTIAENLQRKIEIFKLVTKTRKQVFMAMVSANGVKKGLYANEILSGVVTLNDLF